MFVCWLVRPEGEWLYGSGCASNVNMAIHRAVSEAVQAYCVLVSGTREDMATPTMLGSLEGFPRTQTLTRRAYLKTSYNKYFDDLQDEYRFLRRWLKRAGFPFLAIANLSRRGLDIPVVRAIVPGLATQAERRYGMHCTTLDVHAKRYRF
jgi:ribosomal protein S12 methylthiotransferase accessory factor YcaO